MVSKIFNPDKWDEVEGFQFEDITYHKAKGQGTVRNCIQSTRVSKCFSTQNG